MAISNCFASAAECHFSPYDVNGIPLYVRIIQALTNLYVSYLLGSTRFHKQISSVFFHDLINYRGTFNAV